MTVGSDIFASRTSKTGAALERSLHAMNNHTATEGFHTSADAAPSLPAAGGSLLAAAAQTDGRFTLIRVEVPADDHVPLHRHIAMDESFYVLDGSLDVTCGQDVFAAAAGDFVHLPRGLPHRYTAGAGGAQFLILATPGGLEAFFDEWEQGMEMDELARRHGFELLDDREAPPHPR